MKDAFSCDTSVVLGSATADGAVIFAKNSDRSPNECQPLTHIPGQKHRLGSTVRCQYLEIPQASETWEVIGSRPYWLWGFEIGVNEWGVAIGNEAVHTREPDEDVALIGMDLVRLGLERARTANDAVAVIGDLLERYGQGGSCEANSFRTYQNSFIIADATTAWILETAGHRWIAERVTDRGAISNLLTIQGSGHLSSPGIETHARTQGWVDGDFDFARAYQDPEADLTPRICRLERARTVLDNYHAPVTVPDMMALLRDHGASDIPTGPQTLPTICMHSNPAFPGETAASMVVHLRPDRPRELATTCWSAFGSPCLSIFRPVYPFAVGLPTVLDRGGATFDSTSPWWQFEKLQRMIARTPSLAPEVRSRLASLESSFFEQATYAENLALDALSRGNRTKALQALRVVVDSTTRRALELVETLTTEYADRSDREALPDMSSHWSETGRDVGLNFTSEVFDVAGVVH